jgi:ABC-type enterochelin transport system substrate-binding protein
VTVAHAKGSTHAPVAPQRVVVYDLGSLDTLHTLGVPVAGVPKAQFPDYLAGYADASKYTAAGSLFAPDYDTLSRIAPTLDLRFADVARLHPQWLYVIDRNTATGSAAGGGAIIPSQKVFDNTQVKGTAASQKGQVVLLDPKGWYLMGSTGPTALQGNVAQLRDAMQQKAQPR